MPRHRELFEANRRLAIERDLLSWPDYPVEFVPQPEWARSAAPSLYFPFYRSPAPFDQLPGADFLIPPTPVNESVSKLNHVVHHAGLGHHVQKGYAMRAAARIGRIAAVDCASRIAMLCGGTMAEGWASYATDLMDEAGFLTPSIVLPHGIAAPLEKPFVSGDEGEVIDNRCRREEPVGGVVVLHGDDAALERNLVNQRRLAKGVDGENVTRPAKRVRLESNAAISIQNQALPDGDGREPKLGFYMLQQALRFPAELSASRDEP